MKVASIVDHVLKYLENSIITGNLKPGQRIKEEEISSRLGVSRPPIREAFKILEAEGLVKREPRRGVFVSEITDKDVWEIYTLKMALYSLAATLAIERLTERDIRSLERIIARMEEIVQQDIPDVRRYQSLNEQFHDTTIVIAGHERLRKIVETLNIQVKRISYRSLIRKDHLVGSCRYHRRILEAIKARDKELASRLTQEHILRGLEVLMEIAAAEREARAKRI